MKIISVSLKNNSYKIVVGHHILPQLGRTLQKFVLGKEALVITNPLVRKLWGKRVEESLRRAGCPVKFFEVPDTEQSKSAPAAFKLLEQIARYDVLKKVLVVALGGGVIGDLAGFAAAVYKRGVPYIQVPTTFLAQIDSAIGGKVAVDLPIGKNLVGAFYQPKAVIADTKVLSTLSARQMKNGMAEAIKYGVIKDARLFQFIEKNYKKILGHEGKALNEMVRRCAQIKADVVALDEKETKGIRTILNFGHTVGHAVEAAGKYKLYHHGQAIALGMRAAAEISCRLGILKEEDRYRLDRLLTNIGLPKKIEKLSVREILNYMRHDKKFLTGKNRFVLAKEIGRVKVVEGVPLKIIRNAVKTVTI